MTKTRPAILDPATPQGVTFGFLWQVALLALVAMLAGIWLSGCTAAQTAKASAVVTAVEQDATSAAGQQLLADVTSSALNIGLGAATGNEAGAIVAGIQGAASAMRDYEGLPVAPSAATIAKAAATGAGVATVATIVAPSLETIISQAQTSAKNKNLSVSIDAITEAAARGLDAVAGAKYMPPTGA